jgi:hypothetical protein
MENDWRSKMGFASARRAAVLAAAVLAAALAIGLAGGCGGSRGIDAKVLADGTTTRTVGNSEVKLEGAMKYYGSGERDYTLERQCFLDYRARETAAGETSYEIVLTYTGIDELGIEPGRSLEIEADLNAYVLSADGPAKRQRDPAGRGYTEILTYPVSGDRLMKISEAGSVQVKINGRGGVVKGSFDEVNFSDLRRFVAECIRSAGSGSPAR